MFPTLFPTSGDPRKASIFLDAFRLRRPEGVQEAWGAPPPPLSDNRRCWESAWVLCFPGVASSGEPSGERFAIAYPHGRELLQAVTEGAVFDA